MRTMIDKYITFVPDDGYGCFMESVGNYLSDAVWRHMEMTGFVDSKTESIWYQKMYRRLEYWDVDEGTIPKQFGDITPEKAANIIERAYRIYFINESEQP